MEFESADLGEASYFSLPLLLHRPLRHSSRSILSRVPSSAVPPAFGSSRRFLASTLSLSLPLSSAEIGYTSAEESGESGQIEMLYYLNSVATTVRDLLVDVAPDSPL